MENTKIETTTCDICESEFPVSELYNVEYVNGTMNVVCDTCSDELDDVKFAWRSLD